MTTFGRPLDLSGPRAADPELLVPRRLREPTLAELIEGAVTSDVEQAWRQGLSLDELSSALIKNEASASITSNQRV